MPVYLCNGDMNIESSDELLPSAHAIAQTNVHQVLYNILKGQ